MPERPGRLRDRCAVLLPQVRALGAAVGVQARRSSPEPVPRAVLGNAHRLVAETTAVLSRETAAGVLRLGPDPGWSELDALLNLCAAALTEFAARRDAPHDDDVHREKLTRLIKARIEEGIESGLAERSPPAQH